MNNLTIVGRLTKDAELSYMKGNGVPVLKFYVAVERKYQKDRNNKKVDFIPCEAIGKHVEGLAKHMQKGILASLQGEIHFEPYQDKQGNKLTFTKMHVENITILQFKEGIKQQKGKKIEALDPQGFQSIDEDDLPF